MRNAVLSFALMILLVPSAEAVNRSWDEGGANSHWSTPANWSPNGDPGGDDLSVGDILQGFNDQTIVDEDYTIDSLAVSNGSSVDTDGNQLVVQGPTSLTTGSNSTLLLRDRVSGGRLFPQSLITDTMFVGSDSKVQMYDDAVLEIDNGVFNLFGTMQGNGELQLNDIVASPTALFTNSGTISVGVPGFSISPPPRTLTISRDSPNARIDLDGDGTGEVFLQNNATLDVNVRISEPFSGVIGLGPNSTLDVADPWSIDGDVNVNTSVLALTATASIAGDELTLDSGGTIMLDEVDEELHFAAPLLATNGSTIANSGTVIFDAPAQIDAAADFQMTGDFASLVVNSDVLIDQNNFNVDGDGEQTNQITINEGGLLTLHVTSFDGGTNQADGVMTINSGELENLITGGLTIDGTVTLNNTNGNPATIFAMPSQTVTIGDAAGTSDANLIVGGTGESLINIRSIRFHSDADVDIGAGAILHLNGITTFDGDTATFDGDGTFKPSLMRVVQDTTFNVAIVDLEDGVLPTGVSEHEIDAQLIVNADAIDDDGDGFDGLMRIDNTGTDFVIEQHTGLLNINTPSDSWAFDSGTIFVDGAFTNMPIVFSGSDIDVGTEGGTISVHLRASTTARMDIFGTIHIPMAIDRFALAGGSSGNPNRLEGGLIDGAGTLELFESLHGNGVIETDVTGSATTALVADNGQLTVNGTILQVGVLGTFDGDGVLDVANPWSTSSTSSVELNGGELRGAAVTNDNATGIRGHGLITASVDNNTQIAALQSETLVLDNPATDYDGSANSGELLAVSGNLELHDKGAFSFLNDLTIGAGHETFVNGFALNFNAGSSLSLSHATYRSTHGTDIHTTVSVNLSTGPSTIETSGTVTFHNTSVTTLNNDLHLTNENTVVEASAIITGGGSLINQQRATLTLLDNADVDALVDNRGRLQIGASPGRADVVDFLQTSTGIFTAELMGDGLGQFDRLVVSGLAQLAGELEVTLLDSFNPELGDQFPILSTAGGIIDDFDIFDLPPLDPGLAWCTTISVNYVLEVVEAPLFTADFDGDGDVDNDDLTKWEGDFGQNGDSDADSDGDSDGADFLAWQQQFGSGVSTLATSQVVPEPACLLLAIASVALFSCSRHGAREKEF